MTTDNQEYYNFKLLLPKWLQEVKVLTEFLSGYEYILNLYIDPKINELKTSSTIKNDDHSYKQLEFLQNKAYELGIKININNYTKNQLGRLIESYKDYQKIIVSEEQLGNFLGSILDVSLNIEKLWSESINGDEYKNLTPSSEVNDNKKITSFKDVEAPLGFYFPTSTYNIYYDPSSLDFSDTEYIQTFEKKIEELFYSIAPLNYVLHTIVANIKTQIKTLRVGMTIKDKMTIVAKAAFNVQPNYYTKEKFDLMIQDYLQYSQLVNSDFDRDSNNKIQIKNNVIYYKNLNSNLVTKNVNINTPSSAKIPTEKAISNMSNECLDELDDVLDGENYVIWLNDMINNI